MLAQKPTFDRWKRQHWPAEQRYKPNQLGKLLLVGLGCLAVQVGLVFLFVLLLDPAI